MGGTQYCAQGRGRQTRLFVPGSGRLEPIPFYFCQAPADEFPEGGEVAEAADFLRLQVLDLRAPHARRVAGFAPEAQDEGGSRFSHLEA